MVAVREIQLAVVLRCRGCHRLLAKVEHPVSTDWPPVETLTAAPTERLTVVCPRCGVWTAFDPRTWSEN